MKTYQQKQKDLFDYIEQSFQKGESPSTLGEPVEDFELDNRICLTSVAFPDETFKKVIVDKIIEPLKTTDPNLYFYPPDRLHTTIQNIRVIENPPRFTQETIEKATQVFAKVVAKHRTITLHFKGLFELSVSLALRGYSDESLRELVKELRSELQKAGIPDNKKYASDEVFFGNITVCRFPKQPNQAFFKKVQELKNIKIGEMEIQTINLITGNIVFTPQLTHIIQSFSLNTK